MNEALRVKNILLDHDGGTTKDRFFCRPCGYTGPWESPEQASERYARHVKKKHPERAGQKARVIRVD